MIFHRIIEECRSLLEGHQDIENIRYLEGATARAIRASENANLSGDRIDHKYAAGHNRNVANVASEMAKAFDSRGNSQMAGNLRDHAKSHLEKAIHHDSHS